MQQSREVIKTIIFLRWTFLAGPFTMQEEMTKMIAGGTKMEKVNLTAKLEQFQDMWSPKIVGEVNETAVKLVKLKGEFVWHHHDNEDELFLVVKGRLLMKFRDRDVWLDEGELIVIPRGVEHLPVAPEEVHVLLVEPNTTLNTGNVQNERTVANLERL
jgi:mannose-6-phosphate isomerase-like protein (cupin superfamily)